MKAAVYSGPGAIGIKERNLPEPEPGWVRIGVTVGGICGSDLHIYHAALGDPKGMQPGHEVAGVIDAAGDRYRALLSGTHVAVEPILGCGGCHHCHVGKANVCPDVRLFGIALPGGLAEYVCVPESLVHAAAGRSRPGGCRLVRTTGGLCPWRSYRQRSSSATGSPSLVPVPSACSPFITAREAGAAEVLITARHPHQQELAKALGADRVYPSSKELLADVGDQHVDVVVETVGGETETLAESVYVARTGGRISLTRRVPRQPEAAGHAVSSPRSSRWPRQTATAGRRIRVILHWAPSWPQNMRDLIEPLVTHTFALDQIAEAFALADDKSNRSIKVHIRSGA